MASGKKAGSGEDAWGGRSGDSGQGAKVNGYAGNACDSGSGTHECANCSQEVSDSFHRTLHRAAQGKWQCQFC